MPWGRFHNAAVISCQCSLGTYRKKNTKLAGVFQLMHRSSVRAKCLEGRNKESLLYIWVAGSFHRLGGPFGSGAVSVNSHIAVIKSRSDVFK